MLYGKDITKKMFAGIFPTETLNQMILADMNFMGVNNKGYQYQATLCVPESSVYSLANITIGFDNQMSNKKSGINSALTILVSLFRRMACLLFVCYYSGYHLYRFLHYGVRRLCSCVYARR